MRHTKVNTLLEVAIAALILGAMLVVGVACGGGGDGEKKSPFATTSVKSPDGADGNADDGTPATWEVTVVDYTRSQEVKDINCPPGLTLVTCEDHNSAVAVEGYEFVAVRYRLRNISNDPQTESSSCILSTIIDTRGFVRGGLLGGLDDNPVSANAIQFSAGKAWFPPGYGYECIRYTLVPGNAELDLLQPQYGPPLQFSELPNAAENALEIDRYANLGEAFEIPGIAKITPRSSTLVAGEAPGSYGPSWGVGVQLDFENLWGKALNPWEIKFTVFDGQGLAVPLEPNYYGEGPRVPEALTGFPVSSDEQRCPTDFGNYSVCVVAPGLSATGAIGGSVSVSRDTLDVGAKPRDLYLDIAFLGNRLGSASAIRYSVDEWYHKTYRLDLSGDPVQVGSGGQVTDPSAHTDCPAPSAEAREAVAKTYDTAPQMTINAAKTYTATIRTVRGDIKINLRPDLAPEHVNSFVFLARDGYYDGVTFHRVIPGFMAQTGDPTGTGSGGPGYTIPAEFQTEVVFTRGIVGMARSASVDSAGSQWFIMYGDAPNLDGAYTVFGEVTEGMDVADCLTPRDPSYTPNAPPGDKMISVTIEEN